MKPALPHGAEPIAVARDNGQRPADPVVVSLCGRLSGFSNPQVFPYAPNHDWSFMVGLEAIVCVKPSSPHVQRILRALAVPCESPIALWDVDAQRGMDLWPIWVGVQLPEIHIAPLEDRRSAIFKRWGFSRWMPRENRAFIA